MSVWRQKKAPEKERGEESTEPESVQTKSFKTKKRKTKYGLFIFQHNALYFYLLGISGCIMEMK